MNETMNNTAGFVNTVTDTLYGFATIYGLKIIGAIVILIIGRIVAGALRSSITRLGNGRKWDESLVGFLSSLVYFFAMAFVFVAVLGTFGVQTASIVAVLGAAAFAVGLALQGSLANFAAGVMILLLRPFKVGDYVEVAGVAGSIKSIGIFSSIMATPDNVRIEVPNGKIYGDIIKNYAGYDTRRLDLTVGVSYGDDLNKVIEVITGVVKADPRVMAEPALTVAVAEMADSSINLVVRPWVKGSDYWACRFDLIKNLKEALDANGIEIPFPQTVVTMAKSN